MAASMRVIHSARAAWAVANDADVEENVQTASMMVKKSRVEIVIYCGGGVEVLGPITSIGVVLGVESPGEREGSGGGSTRAVVVGDGGEDAST